MIKKFIKWLLGKKEPKLVKTWHVNKTRTIENHKGNTIEWGRGCGDDYPIIDLNK